MFAWELDAELTTLVFIIVTPLVAPAYFWWIYRRRGRIRLWDAVLGAGATFYLLAIPMFTLFPLPSQDHCDTVEPGSHLQLNPLASLGNIWSHIEADGLFAALTGPVFLEVVFNVVFFVPLGFLLNYLFGWGPSRVLFAGLGLSLLIEVTQLTAVFGLFDCPYRLADVDDLITNTSGALLGWGLANRYGKRLPKPVTAE